MMKFFKRSIPTLSPSRCRSISLFGHRRSSYARSAFYIHAHQDDWQLFRGEVAYQDVKNPENKIIFIYTTAGDAGLLWGDVWWKAREQASLNSIKILLPDQKIVDDTPSFNGHGIKRSTCGNTISYFMRLPDGGDGTGFPGTDYQSLQKLYKREIPQLTAVDKSTSYSSWTDFTDTVASIISCENIPVFPPPVSNFGGPWLNISDPNITANPRDHSDHHMTSMAVSALSKHSFAFYVTYATETKPPNLPTEELKNKEQIWTNGYVSALISQLEIAKRTKNEIAAIQAECTDEWKCWGSRSYYRLAENSTT